MSSPINLPPPPDLSSLNKKPVELTEQEMKLVKWEEFALSVEEHYHALELWQRNPNGNPMGHR